MSELDVEAVERIDESAVPAGVDAVEYVLYGGKGGVGKTTMAAATALASARDGTRTLVVSTDPAHSLSDTFETEIGPEPERIRSDDPLYAAEIDPDESLEAGMFDADASPMGGLGGMLGEEGPIEDLLGGGAMPGADEAAAVRQLLEYMDDERFDRVVIDTAPTGHTLRLLELPEVMDSMMGKLLTLRQRIESMVEGMSGMFGEEAESGDTADLEEMRDRIERLRDTLRDPERTDFRIVMVPEEMSIVESGRLRERLSEYDIPVGTVVVNRVMEDLADVAGVDDADWFISPNLDSCAFCQRRWDVQQSALAEAQDLFRGHDVKRVPLFADEVRGERMLRVVAACLD